MLGRRLHPSDDCLGGGGKNTAVAKNGHEVETLAYHVARVLYGAGVNAAATPRDMVSKGFDFVTILGGKTIVRGVKASPKQGIASSTY